MENVDKEISSDTPQLTSDKDPKTVVKAAVFLIQKGIKDQVFSVSLLLRSLKLQVLYLARRAHILATCFHLNDLNFSSLQNL